MAREVGSPVPLARMSRLALCVIGASIAVSLIELFYHHAWGSHALAAVPMYFAVRLYGVILTRRVSERRRRRVAASLSQPLAIVDDAGRVTLWNDALARLVGCTREQAVGLPLAHVMRTLGGDELSRLFDDALKKRSSHTLPSLSLNSAKRAVTVEVDILPDGDGATLVWRDVTEQRLAEQTLRQDAERLALLMEGANDGLWIWDRRNREFYLSSRWRALVGLPPKSGIGRLQDWLDRVHPNDVVPLKEALDAHLCGQTRQWQHEHRIRHEDGTYRWFLCRGVASPRAALSSDLIAGSLTNITDDTAAHERLGGTAGDDPLTGLYNRGVFVKKVGERLSKFTRLHAGRFAVLYLDLDRFKVINDSLGHLVGDELLIAVSRRLESCVRNADVLARLGGDEFAILMTAIGDDMQANVLALRIQDALAAPFSIGGREVFTSVSIGIACSRDEYPNPEAILRDADAAMYHAKARGKARHEMFDADMHARAVDRLGLESDLRQAVKSQAFEMHYQPIVSLTSSRCVGFEALVRWTRQGKPASPADFIPVAEELGLMDSLGGWVLQESCRRFTEWRQRYPAAALEVHHRQCVCPAADAATLRTPG